MSLTIRFKTNNDAFVPDPRIETSRILHEIAARIAGGSKTGSIRDINGNVIGKWEAKR